MGRRIFYLASVLGTAAVSLADPVLTVVKLLYTGHFRGGFIYNGVF